MASEIVLVFVLRAFERLIIEFGGLMCVLLGSMLLKWGIVDSKSTIEGELTLNPASPTPTENAPQAAVLKSTVPPMNVKIRWSAVAAGLIFASLGAAIFIVGLCNPLKYSEKEMKYLFQKNEGQQRPLTMQTPGMQSSLDSGVAEVNVRETVVALAGESTVVTELGEDLKILNKRFERLLATTAPCPSDPAKNDQNRAAETTEIIDEKSASREAILDIARSVHDIVRDLGKITQVESLVDDRIATTGSKAAIRTGARTRKLLQQYLTDPQNGAVVSTGENSMPSFGLNPPPGSLKQAFRELHDTATRTP